jgi:hypothetical protein
MNVSADSGLCHVMMDAGPVADKLNVFGITDMNDTKKILRTYSYTVTDRQSILDSNRGYACEADGEID